MGRESNKNLGLLIARMAKGDASVLSEISKQVEELLKKIGCAYYKNFADVEDAIQNVYIKLYHQAKKYRRNENARAWIATMYKNDIKSDLRVQRREYEYIKQEISHLQSNTNIVDERYVDEYLITQEIFSKLTEEERDLIVYYYWCGESIRQIAVRIRQPKSTICNKLQKLKEKVKNFFE